MADSKNMDMDIVVQSSGIDTTTAQFNELIKTIGSVVSQVNKLSSKLNNLMGTFGKLSNKTKDTNINDMFSKVKGPIIKNKYRNLNVGDLANIETGVIKELNTEQQYLEKIAETYNNISGEAVPSLGASVISVGEKSQGIFKSFINDLKNVGSGFNQAGDKSEKFSEKLWKLSKRIKSLATVVYTAKKLASIMNSLVQQSGTWIENLNLFAVTFGESNYRDALTWATGFAEKLGVANNEIVQMTGYFKQLSSAIGITGEQGTQLSQILTRLGYDFGSFYNISFGSAFEKLQAGIFSGQVRTLRTIGIDVSQVAIQNMLDTNSVLSSLNASAIQLTQTQKVLARTILTMQAGTNAFGDLARSMDTLQNRVRILQASLENLKLALGDLVSEYAREFVAYGIAIIQILTNIVRIIQPLQEELTYDIGDTVFGEIAEDAEEAKKAINQLPFDKWQSLTSGDTEQVDLTDALNKLLQEQIEKYEKISSQFDGIDERVQEIQTSILGWIFPDTTIKALREITEGMEKSERFQTVLSELNPTLQTLFNTLQRIWSVFKEVYNLFVKISPALSSAIKTFINIADAIITILDSLGLLKVAILAIIALNIYTRFEKVFQLIHKGFTGFTTIIGKVVDAFSNLSKRLDESIDKMFDLGTATDVATTKSKRHKATQIEMASAISMSAVAIGSTILSVVNLVKHWDEMSEASRGWVIALAVLTAVIASCATAYYALTQNWAKAIAVGATVVATGVSVMSALSGFEQGGIPAKSELFYMNENGVPEALINTGGRETNVINIDQLSEGMRRGFVQAIYETGLNDKANITITLDGRDINDSALARALFPAFKTESKRRGGNQL